MVDINYGNYPYVTSANTFPFSACTLGFSPKKIRNIYGAAKIYDTRVGVDPFFSDDLINDPILNKIADVGNEFGATTGRSRKVNWLNVNKLVKSINLSGCNHVIISKNDILEEIGVFKLLIDSDIYKFDSLINMQKKLVEIILTECDEVKKQNIIFSNSPNFI